MGVVVLQMMDVGVGLAAAIGRNRKAIMHVYACGTGTCAWCCQPHSEVALTQYFNDCVSPTAKCSYMAGLCIPIHMSSFVTFLPCFQWHA